MSARRRIWRDGLAALLLIFGGSGLLPGSADAAGLTLASETFSSQTGSTSVISDSSRPDGKALKMSTSGTTQKTVSTPDLQHLSVWARGTLCDGAPILQVKIDAAPVLEQEVSNSTWQEFSRDVSVPSGTHVIQLTYANDFSNGTCNRNLFLDNVYLDYSPDTIWAGDFETGDLSQWDATLPKDHLPGRVKITNTLTGRQGASAAEFKIRSNDPSPDPGDPGQQRAELRASQQQTDGYPGHEVWYGWSAFFPKSFTAPAESPNQQSPETFFTQWKRTDGECGSPNIFLEVDSPSAPGFFMGVQGGTNAADDGSTSTCPGTIYHSYRLGNFSKNTWYDFVLHVKWSSDPQVGFVQAWINGRQVLPLTYEATIYRDWNSSDYGVSLRQGNLRVFAPGDSSCLFIDATRVGNSYDAVVPVR